MDQKSKESQVNSDNIQMLSSLINHEGIGFDVDHCLVRYKISALTEMCYRVLTETLVELYQYPSYIVDIPIHEYNFANNYCVIHIDNGTINKIGEDLTIIKSYRAFTEIDVEAEYGKDRKLKDFDPIQSMRQNSQYICCATYFENMLPLIFVKLSEHWCKAQNTSKLHPDNYKTIFNQIISSLKANYQHFDQTKVFPILQHGRFFKEIHANPSKYMFQQNQFRDILIRLKSQGKFVFIVTNSHYEFMNMTMSYSYGEDWSELFDKVVVKGGKPTFFTNPLQQMYTLDINKQNMKGEETTHILQTNKFYVEGNYSLIEKYFHEKHNEGSRILFLGDNIMTDCFYTQQLTNWDAIAIVEELYEQLDPKCEQRREAEDNFIQYQNYWGDYLKSVVKNQKMKNYWYNIAVHYLKGVIRTLDCPETIFLWD